MNLDETQRRKVAEWIAQGNKLSEIQNRLAAELGLRLTYMDVRLLVDDLKLTPQDSEPPKRIETPIQPGTTPAPAADKAQRTAPAPPAGKVSLAVDQIARPGAVVSGKVTFSDGQVADWYFDQAGRLGLVPQQTGYRPSAGDLQQFQAGLESELSRMGF